MQGLTSLHPEERNGTTVQKKRVLPRLLFKNAVA